MGITKKTVLVTGANGFIGKNIKEQLKNKYKLLTPRRLELDLLDEKQVDDYFRKINIDVVVHGALVGGTRIEEQTPSALSDNCRIFFNIVKNKDRFKKMIQLGSGAEYDKSTPIIKIKEQEFDKRIPKDYYGFSKYICSKYIEKKENIICLRLFGIFGKYEDYSHRFISYSILKNLSQLPITIDQNIYFDYLYIDDFIKIIDYFIGHKAHYKFYNIGTGSKIDLLTIAKIVNKIGRNKSKIIVNKPGMNKEYTCDNTRLLEEIPSIHFTKINEAIRKFYDWYKCDDSTKINNVNNNTLEHDQTF